MKASLHDTAASNGNGKPVLPLYDFFIVLKQNGFSVSPRQVADCNNIINEYAHQVQNEEELCTYLSAVIANSKEEQVQFKEIFNLFFKLELPHPTPPPPTRPQRMVKHVKANVLSYLTALIALVFLWALLYFLNRVPPRPAIAIDAYQADSAANGRADVKFLLNKNSAPFTIVTTYNWGDGSAADSLPWHIYKKDGNYLVTAKATFLYKNKIVDTATAIDSVKICVQRPKLKITSTLNGSEVMVGDSVLFFASVPAKDENDIAWLVVGDTVDKQGTGQNFRIQFNNTGNHTVYCSFSPAGSFCMVEERLIITVKDTLPHPELLLSAMPGAGEVASTQKVKPTWYWLTASLALISLFLTAFFAVKWNRARKNMMPLGSEAETEYQKVIVSLSGQQGNRTLVLHGKNYLPMPEKEVGDVAKMMRFRINDEAPFIDISKTISAAIRNAGFFNPIYSTRTQQCEFLVLIDDVSSSSQQVKLFEYLLGLLEKQNVFIERFYYRRSPAVCYNASMPHGISLEKLSEKFPRHILLVMGNAYQLLYDVYPVIDNSFLPLLHRWQHKAILTPISFSDWGNKEKIALYEELPVAPVDIAGQLLLMKKLFVEEINIMAALHQFNKEFYEAEPLDFEDVDELYAYCENVEWANGAAAADGNILFQWIAATAVWPKINWEVTLAIGMAVLYTNNQSGELNFTNLLRIARIKWMREGRLPDFIRVELLKKLSKENEVLARETILLLLNEISDAELLQDHFAYEEKETQRLINEFILYAYNPEKYPAYKRAKDVFGKMNAHGQVMDQATLRYLENTGLKWETLINTPVLPGSGDTITPATLTQYFTAETGFLKKLYLWCTSFFSIVFLASLISFIGLLAIGISNTKRFPYFTTDDAQIKNIRFEVGIPSVGKAASVSDTILVVDTSVLMLNGRVAYEVPVSITDSLKSIKIFVDGNTLYDTLVKIDKDAYSLSIQETPPPIVDTLLQQHNIDTTAPKKDTAKLLNDDPVVPEKTIVLIQVSDRSLISSATRFANVLKQKEGMFVPSVSVNTNAYNSEITYYEAGMQEAANIIRKYYNAYYPAIKVQARRRTVGGPQNNKSTISVWIRKLETDTIKPSAPVYRIQNAKLPPGVKEGEEFDVAFTITRSVATNTNTLNNNSIQQQSNTGLMYGTICIDERDNCVSFGFNENNSSTNVLRKLNTKGLSTGAHKVSVRVDELKLFQTIGSFNIIGNTVPTVPACDTLKTTVDRVSQTYYYKDLQIVGVQKKAKKIANELEYIILKKGKCPERQLTLENYKTTKVEFCDNSILYITSNRSNITLVICANAAAANARSESSVKKY